MNKNTQTTDTKQRGAAIADVLFAIATIGAAIVVAAIGDPKIPEAVGD